MQRTFKRLHDMCSYGPQALHLRVAVPSPFAVDKSVWVYGTFRGECLLQDEQLVIMAIMQHQHLSPCRSRWQERSTSSLVSRPEQLLFALSPVPDQRLLPMQIPQAEVRRATRFVHPCQLATFAKHGSLGEVFENRWRTGGMWPVFRNLRKEHG